MIEPEHPTPPTQPGSTPERAKNPSTGAAGDSSSAKVPAIDRAAVPPEAGPALEEQLAAAKKEAAGNYDRYVRAMADIENFRRRVAREKEELRQFSSASLLQGLLPILGNLQLGLDAARQQTDPKTVADGVAMVLEQLKGVLERHGLKEVNPVGQKFDPHLQEAISHRPSPEVPEEHVLKVVRTGYTLHGRLLQPASVVVSSGPAKKEST